MNSFEKTLNKSLILLDDYQIFIECINQYQDYVTINIINRPEYYLVFVRVMGYLENTGLLKLKSFLIKNLAYRKIKTLSITSGDLNYTNFYFDISNYEIVAFRYILKAPKRDIVNVFFKVSEE